MSTQINKEDVFDMGDDDIGNSPDNEVDRLYVLVVIHSISCGIHICRIHLG